MGEQTVLVEYGNMPKSFIQKFDSAHCPAMRVRLLRSNMIAENVDAATCDMELLDSVNVSVDFGISLLV